MKTEIAVRTVDEGVYRQLTDSGVTPLLARLCAARAVQDAAEMQEDLGRLHHYQLLKNIDLMSERLAAAIAAQTPIMIVADYDADGATACAVGMKGLAALGANVDFLVPNRFENGYGLTPEVVDMVAQTPAKIILTVDNGIASLAGVAHAQALGLEVLVTDHHLPADTLPNCLIVNPNQPGCDFPSKSLAGVGVMFYVLMALRAHMRAQGLFTDARPAPNLGAYLDLVALGTVADVVSLDHNNRILVAQGLRRMRAQKTCPGISALFQVAKRDARKATPFDMGFALGPRINAAGRLDDMSVGIRCLLSTQADEAMSLAEQLDALNKERRSIEQGMSEEALANLPQTLSESRYTVVQYQEDWHQGVVGIVASRLKERFHRPTIVFAGASETEIRGSGRSIEGLHLRDALDLVSKRHPDLILKFGGHAMAAGLSILTANLARFQQAFEACVQELMTPEQLNRVMLTDGSLPARELTLANTEMLSQQVWGQGFAAPLFVDEFEVAWQRVVGRGHKKVGLSRDGVVFEAMMFNCVVDLPQRMRAVYRPIANEWRNQLELQLYIDYWDAA
ncbi:MAG: single-stranded-DNA-specific exonuclease RecJ [Neisseriaceae bacterium]|nr:single-stranded-DNA-specific exonuclease RecJ [Neisseriaceae bacterium]